ncbi:MAG: PmoA family protein, partial [Rhodothermales bacterium]
DFWNNSSAIPADRAHEMGTIRHLAVESSESGDGVGHLIATSAWMNSEGDVLLNERTHFVFRAEPGIRIIDRITTLTAADEDVSFADHKEGVLGLRMTRALEMPAAEPVDVTGTDGTVVSSSDNTGINGAYLSSEGVRGYPDVWAKRARWMTLSGVLADSDSVSVAILDHPENPGHPTYWHARDYGLFAANPLGQAVFSDGAERLDFALTAGSSTTFRYRLVIFSGSTSPTRVEAWYNDFVMTEL